MVSFSLSRCWQRLFLRWRHSPNRLLLVIFVFTWVGVLSMYKVNVDHHEVVSGHSVQSRLFGNPASFRTVIHDLVDSWHEDDSERTPLLSAKSDKQWQGYPLEDMSGYRDPELITSKPGSPGDLGSPVVLTDARLKKQAEQERSKHQLNLVASDLVPLDRALPDARNPECLARSYPKHLPSASVIIVFHNEARSTLLRTVHSVINRSPKELLKEVILVDDDSDIGKFIRGSGGKEGYILPDNHGVLPVDARAGEVDLLPIRKEVREHHGPVDPVQIELDVVAIASAGHPDQPVRTVLQHAPAKKREPTYQMHCKAESITVLLTILFPWR